MQSKSESEKSEVKSNSGKTAYSCYFETQLDFVDFGLSRNKHNRICNQQLLKQLEKFDKEGVQFYSEATNKELIANIRIFPQDPPHESLVWEHCHSSTVISKVIGENVLGVMRLVPRNQHTSGSEYWRIFHPDYKGGYYEWAIPRGAPVDKPKGYPADIRKNKIAELKPEELADSFLVAVKTNKYVKFQNLLERSQQLSISEHDLQTILTKNYLIGKKGKNETLLHLAAANGHMLIINALLKYFVKTPDFVNRINYQGNTVAHIAAKSNRHSVLQVFNKQGIDLTIKNKKNKTVFDIVPNANSTEAQEDTKSNSARTNKATDKEHSGAAKSARDPQFVYGNRGNNKQSILSTSAEVQEPRKTYRERLGLKPITEAERAVQQKSNLEYKNLLKQNEQGGKKIPVPSLLAGGSQESRKTYKERIGLKPQTEAERIEQQKANIEYKNKQIRPTPLTTSVQNITNIQNKKPQSLTLFAPKSSTETSINTYKQEQHKQLQKQLRQQQIKQQEQKQVELQTKQQVKAQEQKRVELQTLQRSLLQKQKQVESQIKRQIQPQVQQRVQPQVQQRAQPQIQQRAQPQVQQRAQPQVQQRAQPQIQQRAQPQIQQRAQPQIQQRVQPQIQQRVQPQVQQRVQPQVQQRVQLQVQKRIQPNIQQRVQPQVRQRQPQIQQQRAQQQAQQQRAQQQAQQQRAQQQAQQQRAQQQAQQQRAQQQAQQQRAQQQAQQQRAQQQAQQQRAQQQAQQQRAQQQAQQQRAQQQAQQQRAQQQAQQQRAQQQAQQQRAQQQAQQQRAQQQAQQQRAQQQAQQQRAQQQAQQALRAQQAQQALRAQQAQQQQRAQQQAVPRPGRR